MSRKLRTCSGRLKDQSHLWTSHAASRALLNPFDKNTLVSVSKDNFGIVHTSQKGEPIFTLQIDGFYVTCCCWGSMGNTIWLGNDLFVSIVETDTCGNWLRNVFVGAGCTALASSDTHLVTCVESKEDAWPKLMVLDHDTGFMLFSFGAFGLDNGLLSMKPSHVAIVGPYYIVADEDSTHMVRVDAVGNATPILLNGGTIVSMCSAYNGKDIYVCTSKLPHNVQQINIYTGVVQNEWCIPAGHRVTDISFTPTENEVIVFSAEQQILYTFA